MSAGGDAGKPDWRGVALPAATLLLAEVATRVVGISSESLAAPSDMALAFGEAIARGRISLPDPLAKHLPELAGDPKGAVEWFRKALEASPGHLTSQPILPCSCMAAT